MSKWSLRFFLKSLRYSVLEISLTRSGDQFKPVKTSKATQTGIRWQDFTPRFTFNHSADVFIQSDLTNDDHHKQFIIHELTYCL